MNSREPNTKPIMYALIISWVVILLGIWRIFFRWWDATGVVDVIPAAEEEEQKRYIGENILLEGRLEAKEWFGMYTHNFKTENWSVLGAKSSEIDLFSYTGLVEVKWSIVEFKNKVPVIWVTDIVQSRNKDWWDWNIDESPTIDWNPSLYYDLETGLAIDLWISEWYDIEASDWWLSIVDRNADNAEALFVEVFACKQGDPLQDCAVLKDRFVTFNNDSFTNAQWITFYNLTETNTWFAFNWDKLGYSIRANDSNNITTFGSLINLISEDQLDQFVVQNKQLCKSINSTLWVVSRVVYTDAGNWLYDGKVTWRNDKEEQVTCMITVKIWTPLEMEVVSYDDWSVTEINEWAMENKKVEADKEIEEDKEIKEETIVEKEEEVREPITPTGNSGIKPSSFNWWLQFSSIRWFVMWFSKQWVSYWWAVLPKAETLWSTASCWYTVNVIEWDRAEFVTSDPDVIVYECSWVDKENLPEWMQYVWSALGKDFVAKWLTKNLDSMKIYVENRPAVEPTEDE